MRELASGVLVCDNSGSGEAYGGLPFDFADFVDYHTYGEIHHFEPILDNWLRGWQAPRPWIFGETCDSDGFRDLSELTAANGGAKAVVDDLPGYRPLPGGQRYRRWSRPTSGWLSRSQASAPASWSPLLRRNR